MNTVTQEDRDWDELVVRDPESVHMERMDDDHVWLQIYRTDGPDLRITIYSRGVIGVLVEEDA